MTVIILHPNQERVLSRALRTNGNKGGSDTFPPACGLEKHSTAYYSAELNRSLQASLTLDSGNVLQCTFGLYPPWGIVQGVDDYTALKGHITRLDFATIDLHPTVFRVACAVITECGPLRQWCVKHSYWVKCAR